MTQTTPLARGRVESALRTSQWASAWIAISVPVLGVIMSVVSVLSDDVGWAMVTALLVMPLAILFSLLFGTLTVVLSIVLRVKYDHRGARWTTGLVLGVVALLVPPLMLALLFSTVG